MGLAYTSRIDMWSLGCICVELFTGKPLFAANDAHDLLLLIINLLGFPPNSMIEESDGWYKYFEKSKDQKYILKQELVRDD